MTRRERMVRLVLLVVLLYVFLVAVDLLGEGIAGFGEGVTDELFQGIANPVVGVLVGVLATVLAQSSSVTTSTVVGLVAGGVLGVSDAVPVIMGANLGTTITNTLASIGSIRRTEEFRRAFAAATVHDVFNVCTVVVLLPIEVLTGALSRAAIALSGLVGDTATGEFESPLRAVVAAGTDAFRSVAGTVSDAPVWIASVSLLAGLLLIFATLWAITRNMRIAISGPAERSFDAVIGRTGVLAITLGAALTVAVQSSSIATSLLIPMVAAGILRLEAAYPITLGANLGTTVTALLAALAVPGIEGLQVALVHLLFNVAGVLLLYPVPALRAVPLRLARWIGDRVTQRRWLVVLYVVAFFYVLPVVGIMLLR